MAILSALTDEENPFYNFKKEKAHPDCRDTPSLSPQSPIKNLHPILIYTLPFLHHHSLNFFSSTAAISNEEITKLSRIFFGTVPNKGDKKDTCLRLKIHTYQVMLHIGAILFYQSISMNNVEIYVRSC